MERLWHLYNPGHCKRLTKHSTVTLILHIPAHWTIKKNLPMQTCTHKYTHIQNYARKDARKNRMILSIFKIRRSESGSALDDCQPPVRRSVSWRHGPVNWLVRADILLVTRWLVFQVFCFVLFVLLLFAAFFIFTFSFFFFDCHIKTNFSLLLLNTDITYIFILCFTLF